MMTKGVPAQGSDDSQSRYGRHAFTAPVWGIHDTRSASDTGPSGCGFFRIVLPFDQLRANGWDAQYAAGRMPPEGAHSKLIVGERLMFPDVLGEWRRLRLRHRLVYEIDDDIWNVDPVNLQAWRAFRVHSIQDAVETCAMMSDLVTVTTEPLAEVIRKRSGQQNVRVIPNFIEARLLTMERPRRDHVTIGWAGGSSHGKDLAMIAKAVRAVLDADKSLRLHIIGCDFRPTFGILNFARFTPWEKEPGDFYKHVDFDIGLAPIEPSVFNASKSALKAMEYAALGIPVIASDFLPYQGFVVDGVTGFLCRTQKQWRARIRELAHDAELREKMGQAARELAAQHTIETNWQKWACAYEEVLT